MGTVSCRAIEAKVTPPLHLHLQEDGGFSLNVRDLLPLDDARCDACLCSQAMRLFVGEPVWTPLNRPQDEHPIRKEYVAKFAVPAT